MNRMGKQNIESFEKLIARLEAWQHRPKVQYGLQNTHIQSEINEIKSRLLDVLRKLDSD